MKFMIAVDCDGPACVVGEPGKALSNSRDMVFAREQATRETDAAARALFDSGAEKVVVWDNHGFGSNLVFDKLFSRCEVALGTGFDRRFPGLDTSYSGVLMIGYHAMEGTPNAVLAHTYSPDAYAAIRANGRTVGEIALDAAVAGEVGVPLFFIATDDKGCQEAIDFMPWVEKVVTKQSLGRNCAYSKHPEIVENEIYHSVCRAVKRRNEMQPLLFESPVQIEIKFKKITQLLWARIRRQGSKIIGPKKLSITIGDMTQWKC